jgi:hypothetical protein
MRHRNSKTVNLRWSSVLFVCYLGWSLETIGCVDCTTSKYSLLNNTYTYSYSYIPVCIDDKQFYQPGRAEKLGYSETRSDGNIRSKYQEKV